MNLPAPTFSKNDRLANILIWSVSAVVFVVVVLLHDSGTRYIGKVYNDEWMKKQGFKLD